MPFFISCASETGTMYEAMRYKLLYNNDLFVFLRFVEKCRPSPTLQRIIISLHKF